MAQDNADANSTTNVPVCTEMDQDNNVAGDSSTLDDIYSFGTHVLLKDVKQIPITVEKFWSGFDDYMELQKNLNHHENTERVPGTPENGVGAQIVFDFLGGKTYERYVPIIIP